MTNQHNVCGPREESDQPGHLTSEVVWSVFAVRSVGYYEFKLSSCGQWRLIRLSSYLGWSESSRYAQAHFYFFHVAAQLMTEAEW